MVAQTIILEVQESVVRSVEPEVRRGACRLVAAHADKAVSVDQARMRSPPVGHDDDPYFGTRCLFQCNRSTTAEHFVIGVRRKYYRPRAYFDRVESRARAQTPQCQK